MPNRKNHDITLITMLTIHSTRHIMMYKFGAPFLLTMP